MTKPIDRLNRRAKLASWVGFTAFATGIAIPVLFLLKVAPEICMLLFFICMPVTAAGWAIWNSIRCPSCRTRLWQLFFHKGKFFSGKPSGTTCTHCKHDLSLPVK